MSKKKLVISIIIIAIVLLAVGLGVFLLNKKDSTDKTHKAETTETTEVTEANESTETTAATATTDKPDKASEDASAGDSDDDFETLVANVTDIDMYGDFVLDISDLDLEYGDSINITASGGWTFEAIPFYPQFYGRKGSTVVSDYFHNIVIAGVGTALNKKADVKVGETVTITLDERGKYKRDFEAYDVDLNFVKMEGQTDEEFRNAREVTKGNIRPNTLYRGSSLTDKDFNRTELMDEYVQEHGIKCVLDLSDSEKRAKSAEGIPEHTKEMIESGQLIPLGIGVDFQDENTKQALGQGFIKMTEMEGPYLVQCSYGKDRTGLIIALIEALCGATYEEIIDDYMLSYDWLHKINMDPSSYQYTVFKQRIDDELTDALGIPNEELANADLAKASYDYFIDCGMTNEQVDKFIDMLTK